MKWLALFLLCIQAKLTSSCIFDKVEVIGGDIYSITHGGLDQCFAKCYEDKNCAGILHMKVESLCHLNRNQDQDQDPTTYSCTGDAVCYILQRDEVDSGCQRYINF